MFNTYCLTLHIVAKRSDHEHDHQADTGFCMIYWFWLAKCTSLPVANLEAFETKGYALIPMSTAPVHQTFYK